MRAEFFSVYIFKCVNQAYPKRIVLRAVGGKK